MTLEEMKRIKQERGFSLAQLSDYSGVPLGTLQKIFSGETAYPRYATRQALEKALLSDTPDHLRAESEHSASHSTVSYTNEPAGEPMSVHEAAAYRSGRSDGQRLCTLEDYYTISDDRRIELINGVIYDMAAPSFVHQHILSELHSQISDFIRSRCGSCLPMLSPVDVRLDCDHFTMLQPDLLILCDRSKIYRWGIMGAPDFCLEITSPATSRKDYITKLKKYTDAGVTEYWIIDPQCKRLFTYCRRDDYLPHIYPLEGRVGMALYNEELQIDLDRILSLIRDYPDT